MDHNLIVNPEGVSGNIKISQNDKKGPLNIDVVQKRSPERKPKREASSSTGSARPHRDLQMDDLANPEKGNVEQREWPPSSSESSSSYSSRKRRSKKHKPRHKHSSRSRSGSSSSDGSYASRRKARPSPGFSTLKEERLHICLTLKRMKDEGVKGIPDFDEETDIEELRMELKALEQDDLVRSGIQNCRSALITISAGVEIANKRFNPFDIELQGWSQHLYESIETFDGVFERLTKKYARRVGDIAPEAQLLIMLAGNAFSYCFMQSMMKACEPSMAKVAKDNPELVKKMMDSINQQAQTSPTENLSVPFTASPSAPTPASAPTVFRAPVSVPNTMPVSTRGEFIETRPQPLQQQVLQQQQALALQQQQQALQQQALQQQALQQQQAQQQAKASGPDQNTLNAIIQRAQKIAANASEASSMSSPLASIETSDEDLSLTEITAVSSMTGDTDFSRTNRKTKASGTKAKGGTKAGAKTKTGTGRGRGKKDANFIDI